MKKNHKKNEIKKLILILELFALTIILYLFALPFWPILEYKLIYQGKSPMTNWQNLEVIKEKTQAIINQLPEADYIKAKDTTNNIIKGNLPMAEYSVSPNRVIIPKIGVNAPIVEAKNGDWALNQGAWRLPESSTPDQGSNTVISGHRFKYLPPSNLTFYLFDKLEIGDIIFVIWQEEKYYYRVKQIKVIEPTDFSILQATQKPTLTLFTCDPIYSQDHRLVVVSELIKE